MPAVCRLRAQNGSPCPATSQPTAKDQGVTGVGGGGVTGEEEGRSLCSVRWKPYWERDCHKKGQGATKQTNGPAVAIVPVHSSMGNR